MVSSIAGWTQVAVRQTQDDQPVENVLSFAGVTDQSALADALEAWINDQLAPLAAANVRYRDLLIRDRSPGGTAELIRAINPVVDGSASGSPLPNHCTVAVSLRTGMAGRSRRGRSYFIGLSDGHTTDNTVNAGMIGLLIACWESLITGGAHADAGNLVVASQKDGALYDVTQIIVNDVIDSQRRRLPEHNRHR